MEYELLKWVHIISSTLLFGTGIGSAFYKLFADRSGNVHAIAHTNKIVVIADWLFTTPAVIIQPLSGILLVNIIGYSLLEPWLLISYVLFVITGGCWLPVVWLQIRMRDISIAAVQQNQPLGDHYQQLANFWFWLGIPAFVSTLGIFYLMVAKPTISL